MIAMTDYLIELQAPDGVTIVAPVDGWRVCECNSGDGGLDWCDDCRERFATAATGRVLAAQMPRS